MQKNSTDYIAQLSWDAVKDHWKIFFLVPLIPIGACLIIGLLMGFLGMQNSLQDMIALVQLLYLGVLLFFLVYGAAASKWCESLFMGKKDLSIKEGLRYGLSRLGGTLGTSILTFLKIILWTLLLLIPGLYKGLVYSQSIQISHLEKISGGDANRLSKKLIMEAGILRTLGNYMAMAVLIYLSFIIIYLLMLLMIPLGFMAEGSESAPMVMILGGVLVGVALTAWFLGITSFVMCFRNFQYLVYRDENKVMFQKAIKDLQSING